MGRKPIGNLPMSNAERQRAYRTRIKNQGLVADYVNPDLRGDYFHVEARIAQAFRSLVRDGKISEETYRSVLSNAIAMIPPKDRVDLIFIEKKINQYLSEGGNDRGKEHE